ncbi:LysR family transcriptional regulator [Labrys sp. La1]|uniref:LysR family transcriptional regulator n=1 Tax=Labrys sp. La1 TaxID=3404917 RepID=UPI003EB73B71
MELRHLRYFLAVAEELNFRAAAARLGVSQPPLSTQIQDLEYELKTQLFLRNKRRVELTAAGLAFRNYATAIIAQVDEAAEQTLAIGRGQIGTLDLATTGSVLMGPLAGLIARFGLQVPEVQVRIREMPPLEQEAALHTRKIDISFLRGPVGDPDLVTELAWKEKVGVALPQSHPLAGNSRIELSELRNEQFVFLRMKNSRFARYLKECCIEAGFDPNITQQVVESYSLLSLVAAGLGVALVPEAAKEMLRPGVVYRALVEPAPVADVIMLYRPDRSAVVTRFLSETREYFQSSP